MSSPFPDVDPAHVLLGLDFDGTLSPVVDDPTQAFIHPDSLAALSRLGTVLGQIAIVTGRPVDQARRLGRFDETPGLDRLLICGQYGAERWDRSTAELTTMPAPPVIEELKARLPGLLADHDLADAHVEDKGLAIAVHSRTARGSIESAAEALTALAAELNLVYEPGRQVVELRAPGSDKGVALRSLMTDNVRAVIYAGDDLGDLPAFEAARDAGIQSLLVCSASVEQDALQPLSDLVVDGPDGVAAWLTSLADDLDS